MGIVAPKGVPQEILTIIHDAYKAALEDPDVVQKLNELGIEPKYLPPEEYKNSIMEDQVMLKEILEELDLVNE